MPPIPISPRPLNDAERYVLERILSVEFEGAAALRAQLDRVEVVGMWSAESVSVDLRVQDPTLRSPQRQGHVPVAAEVVDESGASVGELLVWVDDGALSGLEYAWVTDDMPTVLPSSQQIRLSRRA